MGKTNPPTQTPVANHQRISLPGLIKIDFLQLTVSVKDPRRATDRDYREFWRCELWGHT